MTAREVPRNLQAAAHHVSHEIRMLRRAWEGRADPLAYTAWFVHCRNLMRFYNSSGKQDEIKVSDFITGVESEWERGVAGIAKPPNYDSYWRAANLLAAHLTWDRTDPKWAAYPPSQEITEYFLGLSLLLLCVLPPERVVWFGEVQL